MSEMRIKRVSEQLQRELGALILEGEVKDPRVNSFVSVTRVDLSNDLAYAKIFVSTFEGPEALEKCVRGLNSAAPFLQGLVARKMHLRLCPKLNFIADNGIREGFELTQKMKEL